MSSSKEENNELNENIDSSEFTPLVASDEDEQSMSPITQEESVNEIDDIESPDLTSKKEDDEDGLACLDKIRTLLESGKAARTKVDLIRDIVNSVSGGKKKSRKHAKKGGKRSRKHQKKSRK